MRSIQLTGVTFASWRVYISYTLFANIELPLFQYKTSCIYFRISTLFRKKKHIFVIRFLFTSVVKQVRSVIYFEIGILLHYPPPLKSSKFLFQRGVIQQIFHVNGRMSTYR